MPVTLAFVNQKGGVGKTTSVINIAAALARSNFVQKKNKRVLIVDMDPQANSSQVYSDTTDNDASIYNLLMEYAGVNLGQSHLQIGLSNLIQKTYLDNVDILPSNVLLSSAEMDLVNAHGRETILKRLFKDNEKFMDKYSHVLIDCQPSLGLLTVNSIVAANYIFVPLLADVFSLKGLELLNETVKRLQKVFEIDTTILGLFFTQITKTESMYKESLRLCKQIYGKVLLDSGIRRSAVIAQANAMDQSVLDFDPNCTASKDYIKLTQEIIKVTK